MKKPILCAAVRASIRRQRARQAFAGLLLGSALPGLVAAQTALAQTGFPAKPLRIVVPAVPGGGTDILARLLTPRLAEIFGQSVVVENRGGAFTNIGTEFVARSPADGYTVLIASTPHAINPTLLSKLPFDPINDFTMISQLALTQNVLVVHPSLPVTSVKQFIALAKARPGALTAGTSGGNSAYLAVEMLRSMAKIDIVNVAYKGAGQALNDTVAGHVQFQFNTVLAAMPFIQNGRLRAIGTSGFKRAGSLPDVPAVAETVAGFESSGWYALMGPAGIPRDVVLRLHDGFARALRNPEVSKRLSEMGVDVVAGTPDELTRLMPMEIKKWGAVVRSSGAKAE